MQYKLSNIEKSNIFFQGVIINTKVRYIILSLATLIIASTCLAHSGRTNKDGCHTNRKTGGYHCHGKKRPSTPQSAPSDTYDRSQFGGWTDADGDCQNTRHEVLIEESQTPVTFKTGRECLVTKGLWVDPYTGRSFTDPSMLDVDHVVPLKEAYQSGARSWSREKKRRYANSLRNKDHLIAVYRGANRSKGAKDPASWLPPNKDYHKTYIENWLAIKREWGLEMDAREARAIQKILSK